MSFYSFLRYDYERKILKMENYNSSAVATTGGKASLIGISVCPKCNIINKIRSNEVINDNKCRCHSCGEEITIDKWLKNR